MKATTVSLGGAFALLVAACATTQPEKRETNLQLEPTAIVGFTPVDLAPVRDHLTLLTDGQSRYIVALLPDWERGEAKDPDHVLLYGDGTQFASVKVVTATATGLQYEIGFDDPRVASSPLGSIKREKGKITLTCLGKEVELSAVPPEQAKQLLSAGKFVRRAPSWRPYAVAHDDQGNYTYIDHGNMPENHDKWRVWAGKKGTMREVAITKVDHDKDWNHVTFTTGQGALVAKAGRGKGGWIANLSWDVKGSPALTSLDRDDNWKLIFHELGIYPARTPTPCEPMFQ